jgi:hypothetical protein
VLAEYQFTDSGVQHRVERELGNWIAGQQRRQIGIMDPLLALSFHAGVSRHWFFPYCSGDVALGFIKRSRVDYVILRRDFKFTKYYTDWVENGIPDPSAELLQPPVVGADRFLIYRFHHAAPPSPELFGVDGQASGHL